MVKKNNWDSEAMQDSLISDMKQEVASGVSQLPNQAAGLLSKKAGGFIEEEAGSFIGKKSETAIEGSTLVEPTKGVQTSIPMSVYQRLYDQKIRRDRENMKAGVKVKATLGALVIEAVRTWLDVQEGRAVVQYRQEPDGQPVAAK